VHHTTLDDLLQRALGTRYVLERELGRGGWATVYLAHDVKHDRPVAIKVFRPDLAMSLGTGRFLQEIRLVAQFQHPHILPLHDSGETLASPYYVTPYIAGESLRDRLKRDGPLPVDLAVRLAREIAGALAYAHARGVVHRDVKPENILLSEGHAVVADFGIARAISAARDERLSHPGVAIGTPAYMAPEQALGAPADARGDVYALGVVLHEMLTGKAPFDEVSVHGIVARVRKGAAVPRVTDERPETPPSVADALARALEPDPERRWPSARDFAEALEVGSTPTSGFWTLSTGARSGHAWRIAAVALLVVAAAAAGWGIWRRYAPARGAASPSVVVLPFEVRSAREYAYLGQGMVDLLSTSLDGAGGLRTVDARAVFGALGHEEMDLTDARRGEAIARQLGAGHFVLGNVVEAGGRLRVGATLYREGGDGTPLARASAEGEVNRLFEIVDEVASELLTGSRQGPGQRLVRLAAVTTRSLPALKSYLEGEALLRRGQADSAVEAFGRATQSDTMFALAYYRRAVAADWAARFDVAREATTAAVRHGGRLSAGDRRLLRALEAFHRGDAIGAERLYREILRDDPENVEAWYQLGEVLFHLGPVHGRDITESREAFAHAWHYDPHYGDALFHLLDAAARGGRWATYDSLLAGATGQSGILLRRRAVRAFAIGTPDERDKLLEELASASDGTIIVTAGQIAAYVNDLPAAERVLRLMIEPSRAPVMQAYGHLGLARLAQGRGRPSEAHAHLAELGGAEAPAALAERALLAIAPLSPAAPAELTALRQALRDWDASAVPDRQGPAIASAHNGVHPLLRRFLIGVLDARLGDTVAAREEEAALRAAPPTPTAGTLAVDLAEVLSAEIVRRGGHTPEALAALAHVRSEVPLERLANSPFYGNVHGRALRAELLLAAGRAAEARRWYASIGEGRYDAAYIAPAQLGVARAAERMGDRAGAIAAYRRFIGLWTDCDPALRPTVDAARARLRALESTGAG
jgi:serine/threonine-protein kinase